MNAERLNGDAKFGRLVPRGIVAERHRQIEAHHVAELRELILEPVEVGIATRAGRGGRHPIGVEDDRVGPRQDQGPEVHK